MGSTTAENAPTSLLYSGEQYDSALGMYNLRARFYDPANGRFNQLDPFAGNTFDPQSLHKYAYAHCDPVNGLDPSGEFTLIELLVVVAVVAIVSGLISGAIASATGGSFAEGFAKGMISGALTTLLAVFGVPLPAAMALGSSVAQLVIEWHVNGFSDPTLSAVRIATAFIMGLIGGAVLNKIPPLAANTEEMAKIMVALNLQSSVKTLAEELGKMAVKGFSLGIVNRMIAAFTGLAEAIYQAGKSLFQERKRQILKEAKAASDDPTIEFEEVDLS